MQESDRAIAMPAIFNNAIKDKDMQVHQITGAIDSLGNFFALDSCNQSYAYNANGDYLTITAFLNGSTWIQTYTYDGSGKLTNVTGWVKQ